MKRLLLLYIPIIWFLASGCNGDPTPATCDWDSPITKEFSEEMLLAWEEKWGENSPEVPDSFILNKFSLIEMAAPYCGFRVYYGLEEEGDLSTLGLVIVAVNEEMTDQLDKILYTRMSSVDDLPKKDGKTHVPTEFIPKETARTYTMNWRHYNGTCIENDTLNNGICPYPPMDRQPEPQGDLPASIRQVIPLGNAYASLETIDFLECQDPNAPGAVIYNALVPVNYPDKIGVEGVRYDIFIRSLSQTELNGGLMSLTKAGECSMSAFDVVWGCPPDCDSNRYLQQD